MDPVEVKHKRIQDVPNHSLLFLNVAAIMQHPQAEFALNSKSAIAAVVTMTAAPSDCRPGAFMSPHRSLMVFT